MSEQKFTKDEEFLMFAIDRALFPYRELIRFSSDEAEAENTKLRDTIIADATAYYLFVKNGIPVVEVTNVNVSTEEEENA